MACACKVNQQLDYLHKKYGNEIPVSKPSIIGFKIKEFFKHIWVYIVLLPLIPLMFLHVLYKMIFTKGKSVRVERLLKLKQV